VNNVQTEITALEERLRLAELGPDPEFFEETLADDIIVVSEDGHSSFAKSQIVAAHQPGKGQKFTKVEMKDIKIVDHNEVAIVTCQGMYEGPALSANLKFMRVWMKQDNRWRIIAASISK
jgi:uncharacterized protein (TIGR02246 family)